MLNERLGYDKSLREPVIMTGCRFRDGLYRMLQPAGGHYDRIGFFKRRKDHSLLIDQKSILIIVAGIAGLSAGCYAQMNGYRSQIFELHDIPGGLSTALECKGFTCDGYL
jgi:myosin-crossreactive antigen